MAAPDIDVYRDLAQALTQLGATWYVFDGQAAILHGATRFTEDLDITVHLQGRSTRELVTALEGAGLSLRVDDVGRFVEQTRVIPLVHTSTTIPVDVVLGGPGLEEHFAERAQLIDIDGVAVPVASPEDIIVMKVLAGRLKDLEDVVALAAVRSDLDTSYVRKSLTLIEQALGQSDLLPVLERCLARANE